MRSHRVLGGQSAGREKDRGGVSGADDGRHVGRQEVGREQPQDLLLDGHDLYGPVTLGSGLEVGVGRRGVLLFCAAACSSTTRPLWPALLRVAALAATQSDLCDT